VIAAWAVAVAPSSASPTVEVPLQTTAQVQALLQSDQIGGGVGSIFAKYDGVDGESKDANHDKWIDVLSVDWGAERPGATIGQTRRRGAAVIEDLVLAFEYEKASPKLEEKLLKGEVIPKLEVEFTANYGGARATYLKFEMKNVLITSYDFTTSGNWEAGPPTVVFANNFEEIKVTYTEYDNEGSNKGNVEYTWKVEKSK
jgi:type VI secretion system secreted protein Hcp